MAEGRNIKYLKDILVLEASFVLSLAAVAPLERVKLLMQNEEVLIKSGKISSPYKGIGDCLGRTVKAEGFLSLWRGNCASLLLLFPTQVQNSIVKNFFEKMVSFGKKENCYWKRYINNLVSICASDAYCLLFVYSLDYARTKLANDVKAGKGGRQRQFKGLIDVYGKTLKSDGFFGLYRGFGVSCVYMIVYRALLSGFHVFFKPTMRAVSLADMLLERGMRIIAGLGAYPIDTIRRRLILTPGKPKSSITIFRQIAAKEGLKSLFKGADADVLSVVVTAAVLRLYSRMFLQ